MKLEQAFEVAAPVDRVWQALIDVEHVAPCLPGAAVTGRNEDGSYAGTFTVKIGPTTASYTGKLEMESVDEGSHTATMSAQGSDKRGQGGATAKILSRLESLGEDRTRVEVDTNYHITGRLARFGRGGMIEDISERLLKEFAQRLAASLEGGEDEQPTAEVPVVAPQESPAAASEEPPQESPAAASEEPPSAAPDEPAPTAAQDEPAPIEAAPPPTDAEPPAAEAPPPTDAEQPPSPTEPPPGPRAAAQPPEPLDAGSLVGSVVADRIKANPWPWVGGLLLILLLRRRRRR